MPVSLDLNLLPLARQDGQDLTSLPGLYIVTPPRRASRHRSSDRLILFLSLAGNAPLPVEQQEQILARLAQKYYKTKGSVTSAMQVLAEAMNLYLLDRNLRSTTNGQQAIGTLVIAVLRNERLSLAHCGPAHTFLLTNQETQHYHDPQNNRGLGLTRSIPVRFYQIGLHPNDLMVVTSQLPAAWTSIIQQNTNSQGVESLRRRLLSQSGTDVSSIIIQAQSGTGKLRLLHTKTPATKPLPTATTEEEIVAEAIQTGEEAISPVISEEGIVEEEEAPTPPPPAESPAESVAPVEAPIIETSEPGPTPELKTQGLPQPEQEAREPVPPPAQATDLSLPPVQSDTSIRTQAIPQSVTGVGRPVTEGSGQRPSVQKSRSKAPPSPSKKTNLSIRRGVNRIGQWMGHLVQGITHGLVTLARRIFPDESLFSIPPSTMIFIAVAVPLLITIAGGVVYIQRGRGALYQTLYDQAFAAAKNAETQQDPLEFRTAWESTLDFLDQAETYRSTPESQALRLRARDALDKLDIVQRLDFQPAIISGLGKGVQVSNIVSVDNDLYLLRSNGDQVERARFTGSGFEVDSQFICVGNPSIGPLIDILPMPKGNDLKATIMAMDGSGNLLYCIPGQTPMSSALKPPGMNWGNPKAMAMEGEDLYVLDPQNNAVWIYPGLKIAEQPHLFFGEQIPSMEDTIDLAVNQDDLYLLHADGMVTLCVYSTLKESPTSCQDPVTYSDPRPGRHSGTVIAPFNQIQYTQPPDPSIYMLDPFHQAIYHFSLKLNFQRQYRSINPIPDVQASAFTISSDRTAFMAIGNQIYYAVLP